MWMFINGVVAGVLVTLFFTMKLYKKVGALLKKWYNSARYPKRVIDKVTAKGNELEEKVDNLYTKAKEVLSTEG